MKIIFHSSRKIKLETPGKINLTLEVLSKRPDGYHNIRSLISTLKIYDTVTLTLKKKRGPKKIIINCDKPTVPLGEKNNCYKAAEKFFQETRKDYLKQQSLIIEIKKKIPLANGLGGSATDAAAVIFGLDKLFNCKSSSKKLFEIASLVGSDVPALLHEGIVLIEGRGEKVKTVSTVPFPYPMLIAVSPKRHFTKKSYLSYRPLLSEKKRKNISQEFLACFKRKRLENCLNMLYNDLELTKNTNCLLVNKIKQSFKATGAVASLMSGSGFSVFAFYSNKNQLEKSYRILRSKYELLKII